MCVCVRGGKGGGLVLHIPTTFAEQKKQGGALSPGTFSESPHSVRNLLIYLTWHTSHPQNRQTKMQGKKKETSTSCVAPAIPTPTPSPIDLAPEVAGWARVVRAHSGIATPVVKAEESGFGSARSSICRRPVRVGESGRRGDRGERRGGERRGGHREGG